MLNNEARHFIKRTERQWRKLLHQNLREEEYHSYLSEYAGLFFGDTYTVPIVISKLRLCPELTTDFIVAREQYSYGLTFELIEIETPHCTPLTRNGDYSSRLSHAVRQIQDWKKWIRENRPLAKSLFPSVGTRYYRHPNFTFTIIIGNRENTREWLEKRNEFADQLRINIRSFDLMTEFLSNKVFLNGRNLLSTEESRLSLTQRNQLANPFYRAYTDQEWRDITRRMEANPHFEAKNADALLSHRQYNDLYQRFVKKYGTS